MPASLPRSSASVKVSPGAANFRALASPPPVDSSPPTDHPPEPGGFPPIPGIQWEWKEQGTVAEAWHAPQGGRNRAGKRYLGRFGKRRVNQLNALPPTDRTAEIQRQVETWRTEKGIE